MKAGLPWVPWLARCLLPARCLLCREPGDRGRDLCAACCSGLPWAQTACPRCGRPLPAGGLACGRCPALASPSAQTRAALLYQPPVDHLLRRFKFHGDLAAGAVLAALMADALATADRPQALVPVPLHRARLRQRGYDQALELARPLAAAFGLPLHSRLLQRVRATAPQSELGAADRQRNVRGAFSAGPTPLRHLALVDDVMTTGATAQAAARALQVAGVARVDIWVCARVP